MFRRRATSRMTTIALAVALPAVGLLAGCRGECDVVATPVEARSDLSADLSYLEALRRGAGPEAVAGLEVARADYAAWTTARLAEIEASPWYRARPEESDWTDAAWLGRDTWFHWTGGNQHTWRDLAQRSGGRLDLLRILDNRLLPRSRRFERFGLINDPTATAPEVDEDGACVPDGFGLCLDVVEDSGDSPETVRLLGRPSGVMGLRIFDNPRFDPTLWDAGRPFEPVSGCTPGRRTGWDEMSAATNAVESRDDCYQPPYLVGISCGFCHISFDPENPPSDPAAPDWANLTGHLGNVYFQEGPLFAWMLDFDSQIGGDAFYTDYLLSQPPGTSDTSRIATDDLDNPGAINALYRLDARLRAAGETGIEELPHGGTAPVPMVLKDGADSVGLELAALRVYVNIGMLGNLWLADHDSYLLLGGAPRSQRPFEIEQAMTTPGYDGALWWNATEARAADLVTYLTSGESPQLADAPGGAAHLTADPDLLARGRQVFADHCAACHASQQPAVDRRTEPETWRRQMRALVEEPGFFDRDYLADDRRHPASVVGVNLTRSLATNAVAGQVWEGFSSLDYKRLEPLPSVELPHPFDDGKTIDFCPPAGGRGTYRTASLVGLWATAPFFHNNSVGRHLPDPSVEARVAAFEDAAEQLLWPERRTGPDGTPGPYVKTTGDRVTWLPLPSEVTVPVPAGYPIKMLGNLPLHDLADRLPASLARLLEPIEGEEDKHHRQRIARELLENERLRGLLRRVMLEMNSAPDFIENKGHEQIVAGIGSDADKRALVELMKTF